LVVENHWTTCLVGSLADSDILTACLFPWTASEVFSFFEHMAELLGVVIVTQPSETSALGMSRKCHCCHATIDCI
jgi:hypothetical protein